MWRRLFGSRGDEGIAGLPAAQADEPAPVVEAVRAGSGPAEVVLLDAGPRKIHVIKLHREVTGSGLKEAKEAVESPPTSLGSWEPAEASALLARLAELGAVGEVRPGRSSPAPPDGTVIDQLERLAALRDRGVLTDEEFDRQKARILTDE
ncbi:ribosomal protein L7/L12 [Paraconexibacter sp.]|uniref:ribosomal protein L7/L12 n=1 Tax=Paraconexibacter sp. TaxID=2949640 RepID=UPI003564B767